MSASGKPPIRLLNRISEVRVDLGPLFDSANFESRPGYVLKNLRTKKEDYWTKVEQAQTLNLFHSAARRVPAYKDFLKKNKIDPLKIKTLGDFRLVPPVGKKNYLRAYPYEKLFWDGKIDKPLTIHSTSGSTGDPTYFQRSFKFDLRREVIIEDFLSLDEESLGESTLFIISFGMGIWSAGMGIYTATYLASNYNNLPISIISPGVNKTEILKILKNLAPSFKRVVIAGYPPLVKDVIDDAIHAGINTKRLNLRFIFTGEAFTEELRDYLSSKTGIKNLYLDTMNTYGTSEFGATAVETPISILARRIAYKNKGVFKQLFGDITKTPTIAQYIPYFINFESDNGELLITGDASAPLIRYKSGDNGGILSFNRLAQILQENGYDIEKECKRLGINKHIHKTPLVYVYERKNLTTTLYGILLYPEYVKTALFDKEASKFLTGKFTMMTKYNSHQNQYLEINLELKKGVKHKKYHDKIAQKSIVETLRKKSSEFRELSQTLGKKVFPKLAFWPYEYPVFFNPLNKQRWIKR